MRANVVRLGTWKLSWICCSKITTMALEYLVVNIPASSRVERQAERHSMSAVVTAWYVLERLL